MKQGYTSIENKFQIPQSFSEALLLAAQQAKEPEIANLTINQQSLQLRNQAKYVDYTQQILACPDLVSVTQIAQDYGYSAVALNKMLCDWNIQYKQNGIYYLYAKYKDCGYVQSETRMIKDESTNCNYARVYTKWTQKGRMFLYELLKSKGILPVVEKNKAEDTSHTELN